MNKPVILTGIRCNDSLTIGNYLGAILPIVELQNKYAGEYQFNMFVPDLHSITTPTDHGKLYQNSIDNIKLFVAGGLNVSNADTYIYRQSYISAHCELAWILECFTYFGEASRMIEFKEKAARQSKASVGLFNYPILMAADILLYGAKYIPVGEDQRQHIELARDLAMRMNKKFGNLFVMPDPWEKQLAFASRDQGVRIYSLRNPNNKMSKSIDDPMGTILLSDKPSDAAEKIMGATTDSVGCINLDWNSQPGISNLLLISALLDGKDLNSIDKMWRGKKSYDELKSYVAGQVRQFLLSLQTSLGRIDNQALLKKIEGNEEIMRKQASSTMLRVQKAVGLRA